MMTALRACRRDLYIRTKRATLDLRISGFTEWGKAGGRRTTVMAIYIYYSENTIYPTKTGKQNRTSMDENATTRATFYKYYRTRLFHELHDSAEFGLRESLILFVTLTNLLVKFAKKTDIPSIYQIFRHLELRKAPGAEYPDFCVTLNWQFLQMLGSDTSAIGCAMDDVWYDLRDPQTHWVSRVERRC